MSDTIIYVDDEPPVLRAMSRDLEPWLAKKSLQLKTISSPDDCLEYLQENSDEVLLIVSDLRMPGMKGSNLLNRIARDYPDIGLMLLTAYSNMEEITRAVSAHILGLLLKPWDPEHLKAELDTAIQRVHRLRTSEQHRIEMESQLKIAGDFQTRFLAESLPESPRYSIQADYIPSPGNFVSGDHYEVVKLPEDKLLILVADVSGHGVKSALVATILKLIIDDMKPYIYSKDFSVAELTDQLNISLINRLHQTTEILVSFSALLIDTTTYTVQYAGGGNPPLYIIHHGAVDNISGGGPALGFTDQVTYEERTCKIEPGDRLVLFTDGLYDRGAARTISLQVLEQIFLQSDKHTDFLAQVRRLLRSQDAMEISGSAKFGDDDLTIISVKLHEHY